MKYIALVYFASMFTIGVSNTEAGRFTRFAFIAGPMAMAKVGTIAQGNAIIHWHL